MYSNKNYLFDNYDKYLKDFNRKFKRFIRNRPCDIKILYTPDSIILQEIKKNIQKSFIIDISKEVKEFIFDIEEWLKEIVYPIMVNKIIIKKELTEKEVELQIKKGKKLDDFLNFKKEKIIKEIYRVEKIYILKNILHVRNLKTEELNSYKFKMPLSLFSNKYLDKSSLEESYIKFKDYSVLIEKIK